MKNNLVIAAAAVGLVALVACLFKRKNQTISIPIPVQKSGTHHITNVFLNAKKRMTDK